MSDPPTAEHDAHLPASAALEEGNGGRNSGSIQKRKTPRFVKRNLPFHQSDNCVNVRHNQGFRIYLLLQQDWFHVLLRIPTWQSACMLLSVWTVMLVIFSGLYVWDQQNTPTYCGLGKDGTPITFRGAFAFSLQTCTTVGYTLPNGSNAFFEQCPSLQTVIYFQMTWSMMFNAFLFAAFYTRLARADRRGAQILMADKAIVSIAPGKDQHQIRFQVRVYDVDAAAPVVEAHVRLYAITHAHPVPRQLRLIQPNDELGGMLFLSSPTVVAHHVDVYSLLHPPRNTPVQPGGLVLRQADAAVSSREEVVCPICAESYGTYERWCNHVRIQRITEENGDYPIPGTHRSLDPIDFAPLEGKQPPLATVLKDIESYFEKEVSEIICVVEGIEPMNSGTFQALQSYCFEDIVFQPDAYFSPCVKAVNRAGTRTFEVDLDRFHGIDIGDADNARPAAAHEDRWRKKEQSWRTHDAYLGLTTRTRTTATSSAAATPN